MANVIKVTPEELTQVSNNLEQLTDSYQNVVNTINTTVNDLTQTWGGEAQASYATQINGFQDDFKELYVLLNQYSTYLRNTASKYSEAETSIKDSAKALSTGN